MGTRDRSDGACPSSPRRWRWAQPRATLGLLSAAGPWPCSGSPLLVPQDVYDVVPRCCATACCSPTTPWPRVKVDQVIDRCSPPSRPARRPPPGRRRRRGARQARRQRICHTAAEYLAGNGRGGMTERGRAGAGSGGRAHRPADRADRAAVGRPARWRPGRPAAQPGAGRDPAPGRDAERRLPGLRHRAGERARRGPALQPGRRRRRIAEPHGQDPGPSREDDRADRSWRHAWSWIAPPASTSERPSARSARSPWPWWPPSDF